MRLLSKFLAITILSFCLPFSSVWAQTVAPLVWGNTDGTVQKIEIPDGFLAGASNQKLIIAGEVEVKHQEENRMLSSPKKVVLKFDYIHFEPGAKLYSQSNLVLAVLKEVSGEVFIESTRGQNGQDASNGVSHHRKATSGKNGRNGSRGNNAEPLSPADDGGQGESGTNGRDGLGGGHGLPGNNGISAGYIYLEVTKINPETSFELFANGGSGGNGGNGGKGQDAGDGGHAGHGGKGGFGSFTHSGGDGGNGGNGGNGGRAGNGGAGGDGGNGGEGGDIYLYYINTPPPSIDLDFGSGFIEFECYGGSGGAPGQGGAGGKGGIGGNLGKRGNGGGTNVNGEGDPGKDGKKGIDGEDGYRGPDGRWGASGKDGDAKSINKSKTNKRPAEFYILGNRMEGAYIII